MNDLDENDPAWDLLKSARKTEVSPVFTQNVVREVRLLDDRENSGAGGIAGWLSLRWASALAGAAALVVGAIFVLNNGNDDSETTTVAKEPTEVAPASVVVGSSDYEEEISIEEFAEELEELAYLSDLMEVSDTSLLLDEDLAALLF